MLKMSINEITYSPHPSMDIDLPQKKENEEIDLTDYDLTLDHLQKYLAYAQEHQRPDANQRLPKEESGFKHALTATVDQKVIVHIKRKKVNGEGFLGRGGSKKVYEALLFDGKTIEPMADLTVYKEIAKFIKENAIAETLSSQSSRNTAEPGRYITQYNSSSKKHPKVERLSTLMPIYASHMGKEIPETKSFSSKLQIMMNACEGIAEMHAQQIYHRDLKMQNILVKVVRSDHSSQIQAKVADFGLSTSNLQNENKKVGNKGHWPPEVWTASDREGAKLQGAEADTWALGIMCYHLFFCNNQEDRFPEFVSKLQCNMKISQREIDAFIADLPKKNKEGYDLSPLISLMTSCLRYNPSERPPAKHLSEELSRIIETLKPPVPEVKPPLEPGQIDLDDYNLTQETLQRYLTHAQSKSTSYEPSHIPKEKSHFKHTITATPDKKVIVHVKRKKTWREGFLGSGQSKNVYEALLYDGAKVQLLADATYINGFNEVLKENNIAEILINNGSKHTVEPASYIINYKSQSIKHWDFRRISIVMPIYSTDMGKATPETSSYSAKIQMMKGAAAGVAEMHALNIVHRDLKPSNIFVQVTWNKGIPEIIAKVGDFGTATGDLSNEFRTKGNAGHYPPEVFEELFEKGKYQKAEADVWALGIIFYQLFFCNDRNYHYPEFVNKMALEHKKISQDEINAFLASLPQTEKGGASLLPIINLMGQCLRYNPAERITAAKLAEELSLVVNNPENA